MMTSQQFRSNRRLTPIPEKKSSSPPISRMRPLTINGRPSLNASSPLTGRPSMNLQQARNSNDGGPKIKVMLRCKAESASTRSTTSKVQHSEENPETCISIIGDKSNTVYTFDHVFDQQSTQDMIYEKVAEPVIPEVLKGYSCTIFAYGQTNTGKTYTMEGNLSDIGSSKEDGIIPRTIRKLFQELDGPMHTESQVTVSMLELYNEDIRDLLSSADTQKDISIFEVSSKFIVKNITERPITSAAKGLEIMKCGVKKRMTAATNMNERSSRSHSIFTITVYIKETTSNGKDVLRVGKLNLVDLAGSENSKRAGSENNRKTESGSINKSLLTLGRVIQSLVKNEKHIPYRESKLTCILKDSLGGHTKTYMIATIAPGQQFPEDIKSTLDYASLAKDISNKPQANPPIDRERRLDELTKTVDQLYDELHINYEKQGVHLTKSKFDNMKNEIQSLRDEIKTKEADNQELKNKEKQHREEKARIVEEWKSRLSVAEETISTIKIEKEEMKKENLAKLTRLEMEYKTQEKNLEQKHKLEMQQLKEEFLRKESFMKQEIQGIRQKNQDCLNALKEFRIGLEAHTNKAWDNFMSEVNSSNHVDLVTPPPPTTTIPISSQATSTTTSATEMNGTTTTTTTSNHHAVAPDTSHRRSTKTGVDPTKKFGNSRKRGREENGNTDESSHRPNKIVR